MENTFLNEATHEPIPTGFSALARYGYNDKWHAVYLAKNRPELMPARVIISSRLYRVAMEGGEAWAELSSRFVAARTTESYAEQDCDYPSVGDWVLVRDAGGLYLIEDMLERKSRFVRRASGPILRKQIIAANFDTVLIVTSLNQEFKVSRLERYVAAAWDSGGTPVILLTKADLCDDPAPYLAQIRTTLPGIDALVISAVTGEGLSAIKALASPGNTIALMGSSGVGKSTLINALSGGDVMVVQEIREDDAHGRHTTTHRELLVLPSGAIVIDTPGMREFGVWDGASGEVFTDIAELAKECRFRNCRHDKEPGCAVRGALEQGLIDRRRLRNYNAIQKEEGRMKRKHKTLTGKNPDAARREKEAGEAGEAASGGPLF